MDERITLEIRTRLDQRFQAYPASRELTELKEEMVADLTEAVTDKVNDGVPVDQAIDAAMDQLGDIQSLLKEVAQDNQAPIGGEQSQTDTTAEHATDSDDQTHRHISVGLGAPIDIDQDGDDVRIGGETVNQRPGQRTFVESLKLVNTRVFAVTDLRHLIVDYPDAALRIGPADGQQIVVNEYMSRNNPRYFLRADQSGDLLTLRQGDRPFLWPLHIRAEIFLPASLVGTLQVKAGNGSLEVTDLHQALEMTLRAANGSVRAFRNQVTALRLQAANGSLKLDQIEADQITAKSQNGSIKVTASRGQLALTSHNGSVRVDDFQGDGRVTSANGTVKVTDYTGQLDGQTANGTLMARQLTGGGTFQSHHGTVDLALEHLTHDLQAQGAGNVKLQLGLQDAYQFDVATKNGHVRVPQQVALTLNDEGHKIGSVGSAPKFSVNVMTTNGNVTLR